MLDDYTDAAAKVGSKKVPFWCETGQQFTFFFYFCGAATKRGSWRPHS